MKIEFSEEQINLQESFRKFTNEYIVPNAEGYDREENLPLTIVDEIVKRGYLGYVIPQKYGGEAKDNITIGLLNEEIGKGCSSVRSLLTVHGMAALAISRWGTEEQKEKWLPQMAAGKIIGAFALTEPNVGSDAKSIESVAMKKDGKYIINGKKKWITMAQVADVFILYAQCNGKPTAFVIEKNSPGFTVKPMKGLLGARASMIGEITLENVEVPEGNLVAREGVGLSHIALNCLDYGRYTIAWGCVGVAQACLEASVAYSRKRKQFGNALRHNQLIQKIITEMAVNVKAARLLCLNAGYLKDIGDPDSIMETWNAKYFASTMLTKITADAIQIHGANGCSREYPVERMYRDAKINEIIEGTTQMHELLIANNAFRYF